MAIVYISKYKYTQKSTREALLEGQRSSLGRLPHWYFDGQLANLEDPDELVFFNQMTKCL